MSASGTPEEVAGEPREILRLKGEAELKDKAIDQLRAKVKMMRKLQNRNAIMEKKLKKLQLQSSTQIGWLKSLYKSASNSIETYKSYMISYKYAHCWDTLLRRYKEKNDREAIQELNERIASSRNFLLDVSVKIMVETYGSDPLNWRFSDGPDPPSVPKD